jgi:hypothetical protein
VETNDTPAQWIILMMVIETVMHNRKEEIEKWRIGQDLKDEPKMIK